MADVRAQCSQHTRSAIDHVLILIDVSGAAGENLVRAFGKKAGADVNESVEKLKKEGRPAMVILPLDHTLKLFEPTGSKIGPKLHIEPEPGFVRVVLVSGEGRSALLHDQVPVGAN